MLICLLLLLLLPLWGLLPAAVPKRDYQDLRSLFMKMEVICHQLQSTKKQLEGKLNEVGGWILSAVAP